MATTTRVALVEDNCTFRAELEGLLANASLIEVVGTYTKGEEAIEGIIALRPEVALIDLGLPDMSGIEIIQHLVAEKCMTECVVLTIFDDDDHLFPALQVGAVGYIVKSEISLPEVMTAIQEVTQGGAPMSFSIARRILQEFKTPRRPAKQAQGQHLTKREVEILKYVEQGFTTRKVAEVLYIDYKTVRSHQKNIYRKLQVHSLVEAVAVFRGEKRG